LSEAVLLEIVQQVKSLEKWSESPERSTMPVPRACDECPRKPVRQPSARASLKREEYRPLTEEERERLREEAEKYFYYAKALLQSLKSIGRANPYVALNIALGCPHVQLKEPKKRNFDGFLQRLLEHVYSLGYSFSLKRSSATSKSFWAISIKTEGLDFLVTPLYSPKRYSPSELKLSSLKAFTINSLSIT
jgi:hypothetical protein